MRRSTKLWIIALLTLVCSAAIAYGRIYFRVSIVTTHFAYLPIVLTGLWWGRRALWTALFFAVLIACLRPIAPRGDPWFADLARASFFALAALSVGLPSETAAAALKAETLYRGELERAQRKLLQAERLAGMGELSAGIAHEINNPLGSVILYAGLLEKHLGEGHPNREDVEMVIREAIRCRDIVRALLDFSRQSRLSKAPTDLKQLVDEVVLLAAHKAEEKGVCVRTQAPPDLPLVPVDPRQIKQALVNILDNALDAVAESGEVTLTLAMPAGSGAVEIEATDNGCGISQEALSRVFTPFFTTKDMDKGLGLGLAITYGIVKMHGGAIRAQSEVGKGTTFTISLPVEDAENGMTGVAPALGC